MYIAGEDLGLARDGLDMAADAAWASLLSGTSDDHIPLSREAVYDLARAFVSAVELWQRAHDLVEQEPS